MAMLDSAPRPLGQRERNKIDKLRRIKDAARELFIAKGFDDTTTREIALRAGVGLGTIFVYAANKRDLLFLIANDELENITKEAEASVSEQASLLDNLMDVFGRHYRFFRRQPALSRLVLREMVFTISAHKLADFSRRANDSSNLLAMPYNLPSCKKQHPPAIRRNLLGGQFFASSRSNYAAGYPTTTRICEREWRRCSEH